MLNDIDLSRADLNLLVLFEAVLEEGHVGRAAERLNLTASAVSHGLGRLRRMLNDPLFLRTPKGVVPTARATALAEPIADILTRVRNVVVTSEPFDPARSARKFMIGTPDGISSVFLPPLLADTGHTAPLIDISVQHIDFHAALGALDARKIDIAVMPWDDVPARFVERVLFEEDFVIVTRPGHPFLEEPTLARYCEMVHLITAFTGATRGFVDMILDKLGVSRRVALAVPNFLLGLAVVAETDLIAAMPRRFVSMHGARFGVAVAEAPFPIETSRVRVIAPKVAMMDAGLAWLFDRLASTVRDKTRQPIDQRGPPADQSWTDTIRRIWAADAPATATKDEAT